MLSVCLSVRHYQLSNTWTNVSETWYVCHDTWARPNGVQHKSLPSVCVSVSLLSFLGKGSVNCIFFVTRQRLGKHVPAATNTRYNRRIVGLVCLWVCLCIPLSLTSNTEVKAFPRQGRNFGGVNFYAVLALPKESRRLVLPRTSCHFCMVSALTLYTENKSTKQVLIPKGQCQ
jgi:hypothetical protein